MHKSIYLSIWKKKHAKIPSNKSKKSCLLCVSILVHLQDLIGNELEHFPNNSPHHMDHLNNIHKSIALSKWYFFCGKYDLKVVHKF